VLGGVETFWQAIKVAIKMIVINPMIERLEFIERMAIVAGVLCDV
jgi:hypothetical protein